MRVRYGVFVFTLLALVAAGGRLATRTVTAQARGAAETPGFQVDSLWPKPLPNHWILGSITGLSVDARDHIWIVHRGLDSLTARTEAGTGTTPPTAEDCCTPAPPVLEFDAAGALVGHWGGPGQGFDWPVSPGGIAVDARGNVWITAAGPPDALTSIVSPTALAEAGGRAGGAAAGGAAAGSAAAGAGQGRPGGARGNAAPPRPADAHVLKFSSTGQFLLQIGKPGDAGDKDSQTRLDRPAGVAVDAAANEVYVADAGTHQRVVVFDATSGAFKRQWRVSDPVAQFAGLSAIAIGRVGPQLNVFVGDRKNNRVYLFRTDGTVVSSVAVAPDTRGFGSVWGLAFAAGTLYVADGQDNRIWSLPNGSRIGSSFGDGGGWPGRFRTVAAVGVDSKGNLYTGEAYEGKRVQKFIRR